MKWIWILGSVSALALFDFLPNAQAQEYTRWSLPEGAKARLGKGRISGIAYSPDGTRLAVPSNIGIWLYNAESGDEVALISDRTRRIRSVAYSPDGSILASGDGSTVQLWDAVTGQHKATFRGRGWSVGTVLFSPDGSTIAIGGYAVMRLLDAETGQQIAILSTRHSADITPLVFSPDGGTLACVTYVWDSVVGYRYRPTQDIARRAY